MSVDAQDRNGEYPPLDEPAEPKRIGFLAGAGSVPDDFNEWRSDQDGFPVADDR